MKPMRTVSPEKITAKRYNNRFADSSKQARKKESDLRINIWSEATIFTRKRVTV